MTDFTTYFISDVAANGLWIVIYFAATLLLKKRNERRNVTISRSPTLSENIVQCENPLYNRLGRPLPNTPPANSFSLATTGHVYEDPNEAPRKHRGHRITSYFLAKASENTGRGRVYRRLTFPSSNTSEAAASPATEIAYAQLEESYQYHRLNSQSTTPTVPPYLPPSPLAPPPSLWNSLEEGGGYLRLCAPTPSPTPPPYPPPPSPRISLEEGRGHVCPCSPFPMPPTPPPSPPLMTPPPSPPPSPGPPPPPPQSPQACYTTMMEEGRLCEPLLQTNDEKERDWIAIDIDF